MDPYGYRHPEEHHYHHPEEFHQQPPHHEHHPDHHSPPHRPPVLPHHYPPDHHSPPPYPRAPPHHYPPAPPHPYPPPQYSEPYQVPSLYPPIQAYPPPYPAPYPPQHEYAHSSVPAHHTSPLYPAPYPSQHEYAPTSVPAHHTSPLDPAPYPPQHEYAHPSVPDQRTSPAHPSIPSQHTSPAHPSIPSQHTSPAHPAELELPQGQLVRVFCKANRDFNLAARHDGVIMVPANSQDQAQQWIRDDKYGIQVKDSYGHPAFLLVNKAYKKVLKPAKEKGQQVLLVDYHPGVQDDDLMWTESQDFGGGYKTVRLAGDTLLNMTVFHGDSKSGGVKDGSTIVLDTWHKQDGQLWKIFPLAF